METSLRIVKMDDGFKKFRVCLGGKINVDLYCTGIEQVRSIYARIMMDRELAKKGKKPVMLVV